MVAASWTGEAWKGDSWQGEAWKGSDWEGDSWKGNSWSQDGWTGNAISPINPVTGNPWTGDAIQGINPATGNPWTGDAVQGINPATGNPWTSDTMLGINPATGEPWFQNGAAKGFESITGGFNGFINPITGFPYSYIPGRNSVDMVSGEASESNRSGYDITKYVVKDVMAGQVKMVNAIENGTFNLAKPNALSNILMNGIKLGLGDSSTGFNYAYNGYLWLDNADSVRSAITTLRDYSSIPNAANTGYGRLTSAIRNAPIANVGTTFGTLAKFNVAAGIVTTSFSAIDTYKNTSKAIDVVKSSASGAEKTAAVAGATESFGSLVMSAGTTVAAIPGFQAVGATTVLVGAGIWAGSRIVRSVAENWDSVKSGVNKAKKKVGSWFKSIKGAFS